VVFVGIATLYINPKHRQIVNKNYINFFKQNETKPVDLHWYSLATNSVYVNTEVVQQRLYVP